jgi:hypothetical protein
MDLDFGTSPSNSREAGAEAEPPKEAKTNEQANYSPIFRLGLYLSVKQRASMLLLLV